MFRIIAIALLVLAVSFDATPVTANPIDFFKRIGRSINHPRRASTAHRTSAKRETKPTASPQPAEPAKPTPTPSPLPRNNVAGTGEQRPSPVSHPAASVAPAQIAKSDLPYGVPVPNRPGFVVSPYSPAGGYVDIRGFPSGAPVKDPYTGKIFLVP